MAIRVRSETLGSAGLGSFLDLIAYRLLRRLIDQLFGNAADLREPRREKVKEHGDHCTDEGDQAVSLEAGTAAAEYAQLTASWSCRRLSAG